MLKFLKDYFVFIATSLATIAFIEMACLKSKVNTLITSNKVISNQVKLNENLVTKNDSLLLELENINNERQSFADMMNRESDRMIMYMSLIFVVLTIVGFSYFLKVIEKNIESFEEAYKNKYEEQKKDYETHKERLLKLERDLHLMSGNTYALIAQRPNIAASESVTFSIYAAGAFFKLFKIDNLKTSKDMIFANLHNASAHFPLDSQEAANNNFDANTMLTVVRNIGIIKNDEIRNLCNQMTIELNRLIPFITNARATP